MPRRWLLVPGEPQSHAAVPVRRATRLAACWVLAVVLPAAPEAQTNAAATPAGRLELSVGGGLFGGGSRSAADATLRGNNADASSYRLFATESRFAAAATMEARVGWRFSSRLGAEVRVGFARPRLDTSISADVEGAPALTVSERLDQYVVDAAAVVRLEGLRFGGSVPFVAVGAGYLRQLHEGRTLVEEGRAYHVGGGVSHGLASRGRGWWRTAGVRADARLNVLAGGVDLDAGPRPHVSVTGSFFIGR